MSAFLSVFALIATFVVLVFSIAYTTGTNLGEQYLKEDAKSLIEKMEKPYKALLGISVAAGLFLFIALIISNYNG